jgi:uncharacterized protein (UPF0332 family)
LSAAELMAKATRAAESAALLLNAGDLDGPCNRAYYAMFDAARAALLASAVQTDDQVPRTHGGVISAFSLHLMRSGRVSLELGRALNRAEEIRLIADYKGETVDRKHAAWAVAQATTFVQAMREAVNGDSPGRDNEP